jgi:hypothetical protein
VQHPQSALAVGGKTLVVDQAVVLHFNEIGRII